MPAFAGIFLTLSWSSMSGENQHRRARGILRIASLIFLGLLFACDNYEVVVDELSQREANEVLVLLRDLKIDAHKIGQASKKNTIYQIKVKKNQAEDALKIIVYHQIPKIYRAGLKEVYPPGSAGIIPTKTDEHARMTMAMQGEIEALLKVIPGVIDVRVVISSEPLGDITKTAAKKSASIAVIYRPESLSSSPPLNDDEIRELIAASVRGLLPEDVSVVQKALKPLSENAAEITKVEATTPVIVDEHFNTQWYLLGLTIVALIIAAYAGARVFLQRQRI